MRNLSIPAVCVRTRYFCLNLETMCNVEAHSFRLRENPIMSSVASRPSAARLTSHVGALSAREIKNQERIQRSAVLVSVRLAGSHILSS